MEWIVPNSQGDIKINITGNKKVLVKISGGSDSAILAYMLAMYRRDYNPDLDFIFVTSVNVNLPYQKIFADKVINWINSVIPLGDYQHHHNSNRGGDYYTEDQQSLYFDIIDQYESNQVVQWSGITLNPPVEEMKAHDFYTDLRAPERDPDSNIWPKQEVEIEQGVYKFNRPFIGIDKRGVAELYTHFGVLDQLFPLTRSCEEDTMDFSSHCGKCWFCKEREWGYGVLDPLLSE